MSNQRSCSFEILGRCYLKTYAKAETLRPVTEAVTKNNLITIRMRGLMYKLHVILENDQLELPES